MVDISLEGYLWWLEWVISGELDEDPERTSIIGMLVWQDDSLPLQDVLIIHFQVCEALHAILLESLKFFLDPLACHGKSEENTQPTRLYSQIILVRITLNGLGLLTFELHVVPAGNDLWIKYLDWKAFSEFQYFVQVGTQNSCI